MDAFTYKNHGHARKGQNHSLRTGEPGPLADCAVGIGNLAESSRTRKGTVSDARRRGC